MAVGPNAVGGVSPSLAVANEGVCVGTIIALVAGIATVTQFGPVTLPTATWDVVTGSVGGLTPGATYYVNSVGAGTITTTPQPTTTVVGYAISSTTMIVQPSIPVTKNAPVFGAAIVNADGTFSSNSGGLTAVSTIGTGVYDFGIASFPDPADLAIVVSLSSLVSASDDPGMIAYRTFALGIPPIKVFTFDATGAPENRAFSIVAYDLS
jgi:hypothetical protein